jgi:hypothetical protein
VLGVVSREAESLSVQGIYGGVESPAKEWAEVLSALTARMPELREGVRSPLNVGVMFHVPGELLPDKAFVGARRGGYTKWINVLRVDAAVPRALPLDLSSHVRQLMDDAVTVAEEFAREQGIADALPELRAIIARI